MIPAVIRQQQGAADRGSGRTGENPRAVACWQTAPADEQFVSMADSYDKRRLNKTMCAHKPAAARPMKVTPAVLGAAAMLTAGCTLIPAYQRPAAPVPAAFPGAAPQGQQQGPASDIASRDFFKEERLNRLIELALTNNRDLRIAVLNVEQTRAQYLITRAASFPTVTGSGGFSREYASLGALLPGFPLSGGIYSSTWSASVGLTSYELDLFGHVRSQKAQALQQYFSTAEAQRAARVTLVAQVATQYFTLRQAQEQLRLAHDTLTAVQSSYALNKATFDAGQSNELDLRQAEGQVENAQISIVTYERQVAEAQDALQLLLGAPLPDGLPAPQPFGDTGMMAEIPAGLPSDLLARRPDILEAEHTLLAANANIGVARAAFFPTISLTATGGFSSSQLTTLFQSGSKEWNLSPSLSVPIFTGGKNRAQLDSARASERIQVETYQKAIQTAFREVADALADTEAYTRQITLQTALIATQQRRLELASLRYRQGEDSYLNELTAQQDLYTAQQGLLQAQLNKLSSQIALYKALGGGWK
jgi:outer membrane protein, multidrug efflux system